MYGESTTKNLTYDLYNCFEWNKYRKQNTQHNLSSSFTQNSFINILLPNLMCM